MLRGRARDLLLGLFLFNTFYKSFTINSEDDKNIDINSSVTIIESLDVDSITTGQNMTLICRSNLTNSVLWWTFNGENITDNNISYSHVLLNDNSTSNTIISYLYILNVNYSHQGIYSCIVVNASMQSKDTININVTTNIEVIEFSPSLKIKSHSDVTLYCVFKGYSLPKIFWQKNNDESSIELLSSLSLVVNINDTFKNATLDLSDVNKKDSGNYSCISSIDLISKQIQLLILDKPQIIIDFIRALGVNTVFLNWTVNDGNDPENMYYSIQYMENGASDWVYYPEKINGSVFRKVLKSNDFKKNTTYSFRMEAANQQGVSQKSPVKTVTTLTSNPEFIPEVKVTGVTVSSITISWSQLPQNLQDHVHYYQLKLRAFNSSSQTEAIHSSSGDHIYMFRDLDAATTYEFQVAACNEYLDRCSPWSNVGNGTTLDGISDPPVNVNLNCRFDNISHTNFVFVSWKPPKNPKGKIIHYNVVLEGGATFINEQGITQHITWGPKVTTINEKTLSARFYNISANTNYTVKISAVTRTKKHGQHAIVHCTMPPTIPEKSGLLRFEWKKVEEQGKWYFKVFLSRISQRNGQICCYRIFVVRMESQKTIAELPSPKDLTITSYYEAHSNPRGGVYIAEMFSSNYSQSEIFLGDNQILNYNDTTCLQCLISNIFSKKIKTSTKQNSTLKKISAVPLQEVSETIITNQNIVQEPETVSIESKHYTSNQEVILPCDGFFNLGSNYTGFIEITVHGSDKGENLVVYSNYFNVLTPGPTIYEAPSSQVLGIVIQILCALILIVLVLFMSLCILHRYTKQVAHVQGVEMITFRNSFRHFCRSLRGRHRLVSVNPPNMNAISASDLATVYFERHRDSDYGFQREFELLPDRFSDRTTRASDARENIYKNRYPDIKAYDQTRVKLTQIDSIAGSDYINANFVIGYKERKKFICAQGPMDNTVCDFWRMIWEQRLELILMLTNLEEYSKTKCAKYWPDKTEGDKVYGDFTVTHIEEIRYSDYIIRKLYISKSFTDRDKEERLVVQYHFLVWKDFMAPEHPHGIIKFIKRVNEAYSIEKGSILVHCSAGVGRTGTLVALDSLLQQLSEEKQVAIFNTIVDFRHQRNFLVQSLKQYIFIYRALMEVVLYGDTEISASDLKTTVEKLKQNSKSNGKCKMEEEFDNIKNVMDDKKSCTVGGANENLLKNRHVSIIPFDRNRVILTPIAGREHSTYINASFIEGYDNSESFIITQDPLEITVIDFWRMISEQNISIIVMLSDLGEDSNKCPRYWPDDEVNYDNIRIKYIQSESCPYYTRREFIVTNNKCDEVSMVTQFQYHGWPTVEGEVPEVTRGLIELVDQTQSAQELTGFTGPIVVHCSYGAERSSMFVGLSILVQQLQVEKRVDVFTITRKLKSQRYGMISSFAQYEFLHRAVVNYSDLHKLADSS